MTSQKNVFLKTLHSSLNYHCNDIDQLDWFSLLTYSTYKQSHHRSVPRYNSVYKNKILKECKSDGSGKFLPGSGKFSHLILAKLLLKFVFYGHYSIYKQFFHYITVLDNCWSNTWSANMKLATIASIWKTITWSVTTNQIIVSRLFRHF